MASPFPKSSSASGEGRIVAKLMPNGLSGLETMAFQYPLKLISPTPTAHQSSVLVFLLSYGGGLVGGDQVDLSIQVRPEARLSIVTQGHTKIFKPLTAGVITRQRLQVEVGEGAALCLLPDPVQPFEGSDYEQTQIFKIATTGSLCLLDWVTQGRTARGEDWSFARWVGRNEIWTRANDKDRLLLRDAIRLTASEEAGLGKSLRQAMHGNSLVGTLVLRGPLAKPLADFFLAEFAALPRLGARDFRSVEAREEEDSKLSAHDRWRSQRLDHEKQQGILWSAANVRGCVVVKFGVSTVEAGRQWIGSMLLKEGTIEKVFGDQALLCVR